MHIEARLFEFLTAFFVLAAVVYGALTQMFQYGGIEWAGVGPGDDRGPDADHRHLLPVRRARLDTRPEDYEDAEISDGAASWASTARTAGGRS